MMELLCVDKDEYLRLLQKCQYIYNESWFHEINKAKVDQIEYIAFKTKKYKAAIAGGIRDNELLLPYSAPFSMLEKISSDIELADIDNILFLLEEYCKQKSIFKIWFRIPPIIYDESFLSKMHNCLLRNGFSVAISDINYQYIIRSEEEFRKRQKRNATKNLRIAETNNYCLIHCETMYEKKEAYDIIEINRRSKGYPLRMTWDNVCNTIKNVVHDFFILKLDNIDIAAAIVFKVCESIYQVIYWGDVPGYSEKKPMNYLAFRVYMFYLEKGAKILDIGPSTENGIPNYGLCSFKESIGCDMSIKFTYIKNI